MAPLTIQEELSWKIRDELGKAGVRWTDRTGGVVGVPDATNIVIDSTAGPTPNFLVVRDVGTAPANDWEIEVSGFSVAGDTGTLTVTDAVAGTQTITVTATGNFDPAGATPTQPTPPQPPQPPAQTSRGQLVYYEAEPTHPDYRRLKAIDPLDAKGIAIPTFKLGTTNPTIGTTKGEVFHNTSTGMSFVWTGGGWETITPRAEIQEWSATKPYVEHEVVEWKGVLWLATQGVPLNNEPQAPSQYWRPLSTTGLVPVPTACDPASGLASIPQINGAHAIDVSTGQIYTLVDNGGGNKVWVEMYGAVVEQSISSNTPAGDVIGELKMFAANVPLPTGWVVADGSPIDPAKTAATAILGANLPDLTDQFIRGGTAAQAGQTAAATTGAPTGGLTIAGGDHDHDIEVGSANYDHSGVSGQTPGGYTAANNNGVLNTTVIQTASHTHTLTGWDAETAPQHFRVIFAVYIG